MFGGFRGLQGSFIISKNAKKELQVLMHQTCNGMQSFYDSSGCKTSIMIIKGHYSSISLSIHIFTTLVIDSQVCVNHHDDIPYKFLNFSNVRKNIIDHGPHRAQIGKTFI